MSKRKVSYQQARSYTMKYEADGLEALRDKRGKRKSEKKLPVVLVYWQENFIFFLFVL